MGTGSHTEAKAKDASSASGADGKVTADVTYSGLILVLHRLS